MQDLVWHTSGLADFIKTAERPSITAYKEANNHEWLTNQAHVGWIATRPLKRIPQHPVRVHQRRLRADGPPRRGHHREAVSSVSSGEPLLRARHGSVQRFNGAGNVQTSLTDYAKWDRALWDGSLAQPATCKMMTQPGTLDDGTLVGHGFGWHLTHESGELVEMTHTSGGSPPGNARNIVLRDLRRRSTVVFPRKPPVHP